MTRLSRPRLSCQGIDGLQIYWQRTDLRGIEQIPFSQGRNSCDPDNFGDHLLRRGGLITITTFEAYYGKPAGQACTAPRSCSLPSGEWADVSALHRAIESAS